MCEVSTTDMEDILTWHNDLDIDSWTENIGGFYEVKVITT